MLFSDGGKVTPASRKPSTRHWAVPARVVRGYALAIAAADLE